MATARRVLAVAAATGRVAYVYVVTGRLKDWHVSDAAARSTTNAAAHLQKWINHLRPDIVVTETLSAASKKGRKSKAIIEALARTAAQNYVLDVSVTRPRARPNKYAEAEALTSRYPELRAWLPQKRRFFENEPRGIVLFEALTLAEQVIYGSAIDLAAAMG